MHYKLVNLRQTHLFSPIYRGPLPFFFGKSGPTLVGHHYLPVIGENQVICNTKLTGSFHQMLGENNEKTGSQLSRRSFLTLRNPLVRLFWKGLILTNPIVGMGCLDHQTYSIGKGMDPYGEYVGRCCVFSNFGHDVSSLQPFADNEKTGKKCGNFHQEKQMVTAVPEIVQHPRHPDDEFVVVWEPVPNDDEVGSWRISIALVFQNPPVIPWVCRSLEPLKAEPQEVFGGSNHLLTRYLED